MKTAPLENEMSIFLEKDMLSSLAILPPNLPNMAKITYLQALIDSSMPTKLKKCNETPKKFAWTLNFAH